MKKTYWITLYDKNGVEKFTHRHDSKKSQMQEYYELKAKGYRETDIEKGTYK